MSNYQTERPPLIDEMPDSSRVKNIKSSWIESTVSSKNCFLSGRGSSYGT